MNELEYCFDTPNWLQQVAPGATMSAYQLLMQMEGADEEELEDIFRELEQKDVILDTSDMVFAGAAGEAAKRLLLEQQLVKQGLQPSQLEQTDPLRLYLEELAAIPVCGDAQLLAQQLRRANRAGEDAEMLRTQLAHLGLSRVVELAAEYTGRGFLLLDLIQEGSIGLWQATERFAGDEDFETFRDQKIRFYLDKAVIFQAHISGIGQKLRTAAEDYRSVDERLLGELGRNPTVEEIAEALHMSAEEATTVAKTVENARILHRAVKPEPEELPQEEDQAVEDTAYFQMRQRIMELLSGLEESDVQMLTLRYGLEGGLPLDVQQTAAKLGIPTDQVIAREAAALAKLRNN